MSNYTPPEPVGMQKYRAPSLFQPHLARTAILDSHTGKIPPMLGYFMCTSSPEVARIVAQLGYDWIWIDWEHNPTNIETMTTLVHEISFISEGKTIPFVRVPSHDHHLISFALDAGASIVVPQVETVEQAKAVCSATKYGLKNRGSRSAPPGRLLQGLGDARINPSLSLQENLNAQAALIIQIETVAGIDNLDAILTECRQDIDLIWIGSFDCRVSMGLENFVGDEPEWLEVLGRYEGVLRKWDMPSGGLGLGVGEERERLFRGKCFVGVEVDTFSIVGNGVRTLGEVRGLFPVVTRL